MASELVCPDLQLKRVSINIPHYR